MKIAIIGSRNFSDYNIVRNFMFTHFIDDITHVVHGDALGADRLGDRFADEVGAEKIIFKPDWKTYGKQAGFIRNVDIVKTADVIVAFWDGKSKGTRNSLAHAHKYRKPTFIVYVESDQQKGSRAKGILKNSSDESI